MCNAQLAPQFPLRNFTLLSRLKHITPTPNPITLPTPLHQVLQEPTHKIQSMYYTNMFTYNYFKEDLSQ